MNIQRQKTLVATLSVISNSALVALKLAVGIIVGSISVGVPSCYGEYTCLQIPLKQIIAPQ